MDAKVGDSCGPGCVPTRALLAGDGTVISETYLRCPWAACVATAAPIVAHYLAACDAVTLSLYGVTSANGLVVKDAVDDDHACLLAWDISAGAIKSGITTKCIGDWQCPAGSLCDDQMPLLVTVSTPVAVCKPGPRGTLTPAMLAP